VQQCSRWTGSLRGPGADSGLPAVDSWTDAATALEAQSGASSSTGPAKKGAEGFVHTESDLGSTPRGTTLREETKAPTDGQVVSLGAPSSSTMPAAPAAAPNSVRLQLCPGPRRSDQVSAPYWLSLSRRRNYRCLHRTGACWYTSELREEVEDPALVEHEGRCKICFTSGDRKVESKLVEDTSSEVGTDEETSSSSDGAD